MSPDRTDFETQLAAIRQDARDVAAGLTEAQFNWRSAPGRWSIAECVTHLSLSVRVALPALDAGIAQARARGLTGSGPFRYGWFARWMARSMEPPPRNRMRTWTQITPAPETVAVAPTLAEFAAAHDQLAERWARAEGLDWRRGVVRSPLSRWFRLPFGAYSQFLLAHARRHLWQAREVRRNAGFPGA